MHNMAIEIDILKVPINVLIMIPLYLSLRFANLMKKVSGEGLGRVCCPPGGPAGVAHRLPSVRAGTPVAPPARPLARS